MPYLPHRVRGWGRGDQGRLSGRSGSQRDHLPLGEPQSTERDRIIQQGHTTGFYIWAGGVLPLLQRGKDLTEVKTLTNYKTKHNQDSRDALQAEPPRSVSKFSLLTGNFCSESQTHDPVSRLLQRNLLLRRPHTRFTRYRCSSKICLNTRCCSQLFAFVTRQDDRATEVTSPCSL